MVHIRIPFISFKFSLREAQPTYKHTRSFCIVVITKTKTATEDSHAKGIQTKNIYSTDGDVAGFTGMDARFTESALAFAAATLRFSRRSLL